MAWTRAESSDYPKIYTEFEGKKVDQNGKKIRFWIQDLTEDMIDSFIDSFAVGFLHDEIICKYTKLYERMELLPKLIALRRHQLSNKVSLICLTKDENEEIKVAGVNILHVKCKGDKSSFDDEEDPPVIVKILTHVYSQVDAFEKLKIDKYMNAVGLYVFPEFRGQGIGQEILNARKLLCQHLGINVSVTFFTSCISQGMAERAGFKDLYTLDYDKFPEEMIVPKLHEHTKSARLMYIIYP